MDDVLYLSHLLGIPKYGLNSWYTSVREACKYVAACMCRSSFKSFICKKVYSYTKDQYKIIRLNANMPISEDVSNNENFCFYIRMLNCYYKIRIA